MKCADGGQVRPVFGLIFDLPSAPMFWFFSFKKRLLVGSGTPKRWIATILGHFWNNQGELWVRSEVRSEVKSAQRWVGQRSQRTKLVDI